MHKRGVSNHQQVYSTSHTLRKVECWRRLPLVRSCGAKVNISSTFWFVRLATPQYYVQVQVTNFSYIVTMSFSYLVLGHLVISAPSSVNLKLRGCWVLMVLLLMMSNWAIRLAIAEKVFATTETSLLLLISLSAEGSIIVPQRKMRAMTIFREIAATTYFTTSLQAKECGFTSKWLKSNCSGW